MTPTVGTASRRGSRDHNADATAVYHAADHTIAAAVIDGTGSSAELARLTDVLAEVAVRVGARRGGLAGLITAGELIGDGDHEAAAVLAVGHDDGPVLVSWIGDCRAYHWRDGKLTQVSTDHTMGQQLRASGGVSAEIAASHDHWLLIGLSSATAATVRQVWIPDHDQDPLPGDLVILTSDGVHDTVPHDELVDLVRAHAGDPQDLAEAFVAAAREVDGYRDDATTVVLAVTASTTPGA